MLPLNTDDGGDDQLPDDAPEESLPGALEEQRNEVRAEHDQTMEEMSQEPPPEQTDVQAEHDQVLGEMSQDEPDAAPAQDVQDAQVDESPPPQQAVEKVGRYYVSPKDRTYKNREERRAEHDRVMGEIRDQGGDVGGFEPPGFDEGDGGMPSDMEAMQQFASTTATGISTLGNALTDATRRIEEAIAAMERGRL